MTKKTIAIALVMIGLVGLLFTLGSGDKDLIGAEAGRTQVSFVVAWNSVQEENLRGAQGPSASIFLLSNESEESFSKKSVSEESKESSPKRLVYSKDASTELLVKRSSFPDGVKVDIEKREADVEQGKMKGVGFFVDIEVSSQPEEPVELKLHYSDESIDGMIESTLRLHYFNPKSRRWEQLRDGGVNMEDNYVWGLAPHFSRYGILGHPEMNDTIVTSVTIANSPPEAGTIELSWDDDEAIAWLTATDNNLAEDIESGMCNWTAPNSTFFEIGAGLEKISETGMNVTCTRIFTGEDVTGTWLINITVDDGKATDSSEKEFNYS